MFTLLATFILLSLIIVIAGIALTRYADQIADATSMGHSLAGLLLLAAATSMPELSVGWASVRIGASDLALGELLGSCLWNLMLLAILDLLTRSRGRMLSSENAAQALTATVCVLLAAITMMGLATRWEAVWFRLSPWSWSILLTYVVCIRLIYRDHGSQLPVPAEERQRVETVRSDVQLPRSIVCYLVAGAVIFFVAPRLAVVAKTLSDESGLGESFLGASFVALVTSLPEAVTTLAAIRLGRVEMAVANIFGSNAFNLTILAAIDFATPESLFALASPVHLVSATAVILVTAVTLLGILYRAEKRFWLVEPDAALVILLLLGALAMIYQGSL